MNGWSARDYPTPESTPSPPATIKRERAPSPDLIPASSSPDLKPASTLPLPLEEDRKDQQKVDKQRTVPCEQCRKIRRACKWIEREGKLESCERCRTTGKRCSGPTRRSPSTLEVQVQLPPARRQPAKRTASIGPSSPEERWSTLHLSYSLTYHLVEIGLKLHEEAYLFPGFSYEALLNRLNASQGRLELMDTINQLFALTQMYYGMYMSNHSALLRTGKDVPEIESLLHTKVGPSNCKEIGMARREPLLAASQAMASIAQAQDLNCLSPSQAVEQVSVWLFAITTTCHFELFETEHLLFVRSVIDRCFEYLENTSSSYTEQDELLSALKEIVLIEIRQSLLLDKPSNISPARYRLLFGQQQVVDFPLLPPDISFIFSRTPEPAEIRKIAIDTQDLWYTACSTLYRHLEFVLTFSPAYKIRQAVEYSWQQVESLVARLRLTKERIESDPRYSTTTFQPRPRACAISLLYSEVESLTILRACHNIVVRDSSLSALLSKSKQLWFAALSRSAAHLEWIPTCARSDIDWISPCGYYIDALRLCPVDILVLWACSNHQERDDLIKALRLSSYALPTACRIMLILESCIVEDNGLQVHHTR